MSSKKNLSYYKFSIDKIIFRASSSRRFSARVIDFILAGIVGKLLLSIYSIISVPEIPIPPIDPISNDAYDFSNYLLQQYDTVMMVGWMLLISGYILTLWIYPLFLNKKHMGQTLGKKWLKITPMYLEEHNNRKSFIIRESFISLLEVFCLIFTISIGIDVDYVFIQYQHYILAFDETHPPENYQIPVVSNIWQFMGGVWQNEQFMGTATIDSSRLFISYMEKILNIIWFFLMLATAITVLFMPNKRGIHDIAAKTAVVNLKTISNEKEYLKMHIPDFEFVNYPHNLPAILRK